MRGPDDDPTAGPDGDHGPSVLPAVHRGDLAGPGGQPAAGTQHLVARAQRFDRDVARGRGHQGSRGQALVPVADHADVAVVPTEQDHQFVLGPVGVLVLVDQDVAEPLLVGLAHVVAGLQDPDRLQQQIVEVHGVGRHQPLLVGQVDVGDAPAVRIRSVARRRREPLGVHQLALGLADDGGHRPRRQPLGVQPQLGHDDLHQPARVGVVVDGERRPVAQAAGVRAQDPQAGRVEGGDPHALGSRADQLDHPPAHLLGRLVGEGDGQDLPGGGVPGRQQMGDASGQHPGLARTGAGHHQQRPVPVLHRGPLGRVELGHQRLGMGQAQGGPVARATAGRGAGGVGRAAPRPAAWPAAVRPLSPTAAPAGRRPTRTAARR